MLSLLHHKRAAGAVETQQSEDGQIGSPKPKLTPEEESDYIHHAVSMDALPTEVQNSKKSKHRSFYWYETELGLETAHVNLDDLVTQVGVPEKVLSHHIKQELSDEAALKSLPFALLLVIFFALLNTNQNSQYSINSIEDSIDFDISENANFAFSQPGNMGFKTFQDVNSHADFWSWMNRGFVPLYFQTSRGSSENSGLDLGPLPLADQRTYLNMNRKIGPVRLRQEAASSFECPNPTMAPLFNLANETMACSYQPSITLYLKPTEYEVLTSSFVEDHAKTQWLEGDVPSVVKQLETQKWLTKETSRIEVSFLTYNGAVDMITMTNIHFMLPRSGRIYKEITHWTTKLKPYADGWNYLFDILFYGQITWIFGVEAWEVTCELRKQRFDFKKFLNAYLGFWNTVDWVSVIMAYAILVTWFVRLNMMAEVEGKLLDLPASYESTANCAPTCISDYEAIFDSLTDVGMFQLSSTLLGAFYPVCIMLRLFKAFSAQPRLALVTKTLYDSSGDLAHFLIVFVSVFSTYAIMAVALFGREVENFASFDRAILSLFRSLMGDFDIEEMNESGREWTFFYFFTFMVLMFLVMLNMIIAIIMDVYAETKKASLSSETLWEQSYETWQRFRRNWKGERLSLPTLQAALESTAALRDDPKLQDPADCEMLVTTNQFVEYLAKQNKNLPLSQAERTLKAAAERWSKLNTSDLELAEVLTTCEVLTKRLDHIIENLGRYRASTGPAMALEPPAMALGQQEDLTSRSPEVLAESVPLEKLLKAASMRLDCEVTGRNGPPAALRHILTSMQLLCEKPAEGEHKTVGERVAV